MILDSIQDIIKQRLPQYDIKFEKKLKNEKDALYNIFVNDIFLTTINIEQLEYDFKFLTSSRHQLESLIAKYLIDKISTLEQKHKSLTNNINEERILHAYELNGSGLAAARYLGITKLTFDKLVNDYKLKDKLKVISKKLTEERKSRTKAQKHGTKSINKLFTLFFEGRPLDYMVERDEPLNSFKLKSMLLKYNFKEEKCDICGFNHERLSDKRIPLLVDYIDNNMWNTRLDNVRFVCLNCYFLYIGTPWFVKKFNKFAKMKMNKLKEVDSRIKLDLMNKIGEQNDNHKTN